MKLIHADKIRENQFHLRHLRSHGFQFFSNSNS